MQNKATFAGLVTGMLLLVSGGTYYFTSTHYQNAEKQLKIEHAKDLAEAKSAISESKRELRDTKSKHVDDVFKLRVCINYTLTTDDEVNCFRKFDKGILPNPTIDDYNNLPDLY